MRSGTAPKLLGTQALVIAGQSPAGKFYNQGGQGLPFYQGKKDFGDRELMPPTTWTTQTTKEALPGDILMSVRAPVGPINFARDRVCIGRGLAAIRCRDGLDPDFLFYQLLGMQAKIAGKEGAVFASINKAEIEALPIFVPAPFEQRRIVAMLDEFFAAIAIAKARVCSAPADRKQARGGAAPSTRAAVCWVAVTLNGRYAIGPNGALMPLGAVRGLPMGSAELAEN